MKISSDLKYKVAAVKIAPDRIGFGYVSNDYYIYPGDFVEMEDDSRGTVIVVDDYIPAEDVIKMEQFSMIEFQRIIATFRRNECEWEDEG